MTLIDENNEYLVKNYLFTYLTTGRDLVRLTLKYNPKEQPIMLANPNYDNATPQPVLVADNRGDNKRSTDLASLNFSPLPGTKKEAEAIAKIVPKITIYTEGAATENNVKKVKAPQILYLATHGFFLQDVEKVVSDSPFGRGLMVEPTETIAQQKPILNAENPLLRSGLALSGFNKRNSGAEDGVLTAFEVAGLNLRGNKLLVLSACETGVGDVKNGEGVYGLRRAFVLAGSESQLMSLWQVSDDGTKDLMVNYYNRILRKNEPRSEALRQVQLEMLGSSNYAHPFYWGAFIFNGQGTPMK